MIRNKMLRNICFILAFIIYAECLPGIPVYALQDMLPEEEISETTDAEHTEASAEDYTYTLSDDVATSSGVVVEEILTNETIPEQTTETTAIPLSDSVVSGSVFDYVIEKNDFSDEVYDILSGRRAYSSLSPKEKELLNDYAYLREDTMLQCEEYGLTLSESAPVAIIMQRLNINLSDALSMINRCGSVTTALEQSGLFRRAEYVTGELSDDSINCDLIDLMVRGYTANEVISAYIAAEVMDAEPSDIIKPEEYISFERDNNEKPKSADNLSAESVLETENSLTSGSAINIIENIVALPKANQDMSKDPQNDISVILDSEDIFVKDEIIDRYISENNITKNDFKQAYLKEKASMGLAPVTESGDNGISTMSLTFNKDIYYLDAQFKTGPDIDVQVVDDHVDQGTGELTVVKNIYKSKGLNGLDLDLNLIYQSNTRTFNDVEGGRFYLTRNWAFNFPYLLSQKYERLSGTNSMKYVVTPEGAAYEVGTPEPVTNVYKASIYRYNLPLSYSKYRFVFEDFNNSVYSGGSYFLEHIDGTKYFFDGYGRWVATENRFGNMITLTGGGDDYTLTDTLGNVISIHSDVDATSFVFPDKTKYIITMEQGGENVSYEYVITKITDRNNKQTSFNHVSWYDDNCGASKHTNLLLTDITSPSGKKNHYEYVLTKVNTCEKSDTDTKTRKYPRIVSKWIEYKNDASAKKYNMETYDFDGVKDYTHANSALRVFPQNQYGRYSGHLCRLSYSRSYNFICPDCGKSLTALVYGGTIKTSDNSEYDADHYQYRTTASTDDYTVEQNCDYLNRPYSQTVTYGSKDSPTVIVRTEYTYKDSTTNGYKAYYAIPYPETVETQTTDVKTNQTITKTEHYSYDLYGNVLSYTVSEGSKDSGKVLYSETHTYDDTLDPDSNEHFWLEKEAVYQKNSSDKIIIKNNLVTKENEYGEFTADSGSFANKCIRSTETYLNEDLAAKTSYTYYSNFLLHSKKDYIENDGLSFFTTEYKYADDETKSASAPVAASPVLIEQFDQSHNLMRSEGYEYNYEGAPVIYKDGNGNYTAYSYDGYGNLTSEIRASDRDALKTSKKKTYSYNYDEAKCRVTLENGTYTDYDYDPAWNLTTAKFGGSYTYRYEYDNYMRPVKFTEGKAAAVYKYDNMDRIISETISEGSTVLSHKTFKYEQNNKGWLTTETIEGDADCENVVNKVQNDILDRTIETNFGGNKTAYSYDFLGNVIKSSNVIDSSSTYDTVYTYDIYGNAVSAVSYPGNNVSDKVSTSAKYDMLGRLESSTDAKNNTTYYQNDIFGNVVETKTPLYVDNSGSIVYSITERTYDGANNLTSESISDGIKASYVYDYKDRLISSAVGNEIVEYTYDEADNMTSMTSGGENTHTYKYDALNRLVEYTDALGSSETYSYDTYNNLVKKIQRNGVAVSFTYDALHRKLSESTNDYWGTNTFTYGRTGSLTSASNQNSKKTYKYNSSGLVKSQETISDIYYDNYPDKIDKTYDSRGNLILEKYSHKGAEYQQIKYSYDSRSRLSTVRVSEDSGASFSQKASYTYDVNDNLIKATYGNRLSDNYTYNLNNLVSDMSIKSSSGPTLRSMSYVYNRAGNMTEKNENISGKITNVTYDYDNTNRLISETATGADNYRYAYGYDSSGNRTSLDFYRDDVLKYNEIYSYDKNNRLILSSRTDERYRSSTRYQYDANGNQTIVERYKDNADGILKLNTEGPEDGYDFIANLEYFTYNGFNQLTDYKTYGNTNMKEDLTFSSYKTVQYTYYADGLRASKTVSLDDKVMYLWNGDNIYAETTDIKNAPGERYYRGHQLICDNSNNYYMHNAHGDVVFIHNGAAELNSYTYDAFGNSDSQMKFGYCEQQYDAETGLYYLRARYYNSSIGRFITEDPIKDGSNWYCYCSGNPIIKFDSNGNAPQWVENIFNDVKNVFNNTMSFTDGVVFGIGESISFGFSNIIESYEQPTDEKLYYAGKIAGDSIVMVDATTAAFAASGASLLLTSTGQVYISVPAASAATACVGLVVSSAANMQGNISKFQASINSSTNPDNWKNGQSAEDVINKSNHIFDNKLHDHNMDGVLKQFDGDKITAYKHLTESTQSIIDRKGITNGNIEEVVKLKGYDITVKCCVKDGMARVTTAYIPK